ncbi:hypothetical protein NADFUDRAFT_84365 [Nadsonia fulvescens var. elongata DSM 6958]|uniref:Glycosyl transferase family 25 domain-containing protein n=1 Tax=Nadsonia fulvescens var. elongata DSM 6958 TaxID=857566 RepID=A0A1E3PFW8_9ASCO|nr:hypothetical protein NADFUDRAFT_84365 [Nadsonia fulvescens var. elongata DSM 6958]
MLLSFRFRTVVLLLLGACTVLAIWLTLNYEPFNSVQPLSAGNSTLGFDKIKVINLPHRYDREDAISMQSMASDIDYEMVLGVYAKDLQDSGLPPASRPLTGEGSNEKNAKACFRAHANIWRQMLDEKWGSALILEADAAWDVEIRAIMQRVSYALKDLTDKYPLSSSEAMPTERDPYNLAKWDIIMVGHCNEKDKHGDEYIVFPDPDSPIGKSYKDTPLNDQRVIRRSGGTVCTTAYAISPSGALKLLLRSAIDLDSPVDLIIEGMVQEGTLISYSVHPPPFAQWQYEEHLGADGHNSDIRSVESKSDDKSAEAWKKVHETMNVWRLGSRYQDSTFRHPAFGALKKMAFGESSN